jgi:hypothetical protein
VTNRDRVVDCGWTQGQLRERCTKAWTLAAAVSKVEQLLCVEKGLQMLDPSGTIGKAAVPERRILGDSMVCLGPRPVSLCRA